MFKIDTYLYTAERNIDSSKEAMKRALVAKGWNVVSIEVTPVNGWMGFGGNLAESQPTTITMSRAGASSAAAQEAVEDAIRKTGNYSVAGSLSVLVADLGSGDAFEEDGRYSGALDGFKFLAVALVAVSLVVIVGYVAPLIRVAAKAGNA